ncbi:MAG: DUF1963 domain-containing protein [Verrucomicrobia bacterium]|nr:DUF1963 domain-containing protein [Verrucomicrobiota bacterium]MCH8513790.1 DUF1963 domain-containing protein [Kiritimatiellia bacterium]
MKNEIKNIVEKHKTPCLIGSVSPSMDCPIGHSKKGGFPDEGDDFSWPVFREKHLSFIAQIEVRHIIGEEVPGIILFFWNERNWGGSRKDEGAFRVIVQTSPGQRLSDAPRTEYKSLGFIKKVHTPTIWREEKLDFCESFCLPPIERLNYNWDYDRDDLYFQEMEKLNGFFRIGGPPNPVQNDCMEEDCARIQNVGPKESWKLLLEIDSQSDMMWGDAGKLYWFIHQDDLLKRDFSKVWMQMQCH